VKHDETTRDIIIYNALLWVSDCISKVTVDQFVRVNWNCRQEQFENSAAGRAARAHQQAIAKQSANTNKGEPVLKVW